MYGCDLNLLIGDISETGEDEIEGGDDAGDMSPEVHYNSCNHCYILGMPDSRPDIRCVSNMCNNLLEPSRMGTYATYPYRELHGYSTLIVYLLWSMIPVTQHRFHVFLRGVISTDH
jgi:hypothetical protein